MCVMWVRRGAGSGGKICFDLFVMPRVNEVLCVEEGFDFQLFLFSLEVVKVDNTESDDGGYAGAMDVEYEQKERWAGMRNEREKDEWQKESGQFLLSTKSALNFFFLSISCVFFSFLPVRCMARERQSTVE